MKRERERKRVNCRLEGAPIYTKVTSPSTFIPIPIIDEFVRLIIFETNTDFLKTNSFFGIHCWSSIRVGRISINRLYERRFENVEKKKKRSENRSDQQSQSQQFCGIVINLFNTVVSVCELM